jgi:hypothetical protein
MRRSPCSPQPHTPLLLNLISKPPLQYVESVNVAEVRAVAYRWNYEQFFILESHQFLYFFLRLIFTVTIQCKQKVLQSNIINLTAW